MHLGFLCLDAGCSMMFMEVEIEGMPLQLLTCCSQARSEGDIVQRPLYKHCCVYSCGVCWERCCLRFAHVSFSLFAIIVVLLGYISPLGGGE